MIKLDRARELLFRTGYLLQKVKSNKKVDFFITPGGPVTEAVAKRILQHPCCREVDAGLFPEIAQSWTLKRAPRGTPGATCRTNNLISKKGERDD